MKAILLIALCLTLSSAWYVDQPQCCGSGTYWDNVALECKACNANCTACDQNSATHNNTDLDGCVCAADDCKEGMCDGSGCTECNAVAEGETAFTLSNGACFTCSDTNCLTCPTEAATCTGCAATYALVAGACQKCSDGCDLCIDSTICRRCATGYVLSSSTICTQCSTNCDECSSATVCTTCETGYGLVANACVQCTVTGCNNCSAAATCTTCADKYLLNGTGCDACDDTNCKTCSPKDTCSTCMSTHYKPTTGVCVVCDTSVKCLTCKDAATTCTSCSDTSTTDFSTYDSTNNVCHTGCTTRATTTSCTTCASTKYLASGHCITCTSNATTCTYTAGSGANVATACDAWDATPASPNAYILDAGVCQTCGANTKSCTWVSGAAATVVCIDGRGLGNDGVCTACGTNVKGCTDANTTGTPAMTTVTACNDNFVLSTHTTATDVTCIPCQADGQAKACAQGANDAATAGGTASECVSNAVFNSSNVCVTCTTIANIATCTWSGTAVVAATCTNNLPAGNNFFLDAANATPCQACDATCQVCTAANACTTCKPVTAATRLARSNTAGVCADCANDFTNACTSTAATGCISGYYLNDATAAVCTICKDNCATCTGTGSGTSHVYKCQSCTSPYVLESEQCNAQCASNCVALACGNYQNTCTDCMTNYMITALTCIACTDQCKTCTYDTTATTTTCTECNLVHAKVGSGATTTCEACSDGCSVCTSSSVCTTCLATHMLDSNACTPCEAGCNGCTKAAGCTACLTGFRSVAPAGTVTTTTCAACSANCNTCTDTACSACATGWFLNDAKSCEACATSCSACSKTACTTCISGFMPDGTNCAKCADNCGSCTVAGECNDSGCNEGYTFMTADKSCAATITASTCETGTYYENNLCSDCGENCTACTSSGCTVCANGNGPVTGGTTCAACTASVAGMTQCDVDLATPTACEDGYGVIGGTCAKCSVANCGDCSAADVCTTCSAGWTASSDGKTCHACGEGCSSCASQCHCLSCFEAGKAAVNCGCGADETWNSATNTCDGEVAPETEDDGASTASASANVMKFFVSALVALFALL